MSGSSMGKMSRCLKVLHSSVQTIYASKDMMGMFNYPTAQEGERFNVPEIKVLLFKSCKLTLDQKLKIM